MTDPAALRRTSPVGLALIQTYEGYRATRYLCPAGKWTIGYGHVIGAAEWPRLDKARLSPAQAAALLVEDLAYCEDLIARHVTAPLAQLQFDALASLLYNVGPGRLGARDGIIWLKTGQPSTLLAKLNAADYAGAAAEFPRWRFGAGQPLAGLIKRRAAERALFESAL